MRISRSNPSKSKLSQRLNFISVPLQRPGRYLPGVWYAHTALAIISVATVKVSVVADSPCGDSIHAVVCYAMNLAGANMIL
jgi:hypothetical protein